MRASRFVDLKQLKKPGQLKMLRFLRFVKSSLIQPFHLFMVELMFLQVFEVQTLMAFIKLLYHLCVANGESHAPGVRGKYIIIKDQFLLGSNIF